ncbi:MAG: hypothetical protein ACE5HI_13300 [bacterium]
MAYKSDIHKKILFAAAGLAEDGLTPVPDKEIALRLLGGWYKNQERRGRYRIRKIFAKLKHQGFIEIPIENDGKKIILTEAGKKKVLEYQLNDLKIRRPSRWDKKWRVIIFNVPENLKRARSFFQRKLKGFGFQLMQKSVWVYPYECENEINFIAESFGIKEFVKIVDANHFDGEEVFKEKFGL